MLFFCSIKIKKILFTQKADVNIQVNIDCDVVERNGREYMNITGVHPQLHIAHLSADIEYENIGPFVSHIANGLFDSNWRKLLETINPDLELHIGDVIKLILVPIFDEVAINELIYKKSILRTILIDWISDKSSSRSGSVVQKLAFGLFACSLLISTRTFQ